jgi:hypothetical protein
VRAVDKQELAAAEVVGLYKGVIVCLDDDAVSGALPAFYRYACAPNQLPARS